MPTLYILCGPSGCGKTTWAKNFINEHKQEHIHYVSRDEIRFSILEEDDDYFAHEVEVFKQFTTSLAQALLADFDVIADATHLNAYSRKRLTNAIDMYIHKYEIIYVVFNTIFNQCLINNEEREGRSYVHPNVISGMFRSYKKPVLTEDSRAKHIISVGEEERNFAYLNWPYGMEV